VPTDAADSAPLGGLTLRRGLGVVLWVALAVSVASLMASPFAGWEREDAVMAHEAALGVVLLVFCPLVLLAVERGRTWADLRAVRVHSKQHAYVVAGLAPPLLLGGLLLQLVYNGLLYGEPPWLGDEVESAVTLVGVALLSPLWGLATTRVTFLREGFAPGPLFRSYWTPAARPRVAALTLNAVMFSVLALPCALVAPLMVPGCLLVVYACLVVRAGAIAGVVARTPEAP